MKERYPLLAGSVLGGTGVLLGAFGSHVAGGLLLGRGTRGVWDEAMTFQLLHAAALLGLAGWMRTAPHGAAAHRIVRSVQFLVAGTILFSGSLYLYALGGPHLLVWLTPIGGLALIAGWFYATGAALAPRSEYDL